MLDRWLAIIFNRNPKQDLKLLTVVRCVSNLKKRKQKQYVK